MTAFISRRALLSGTGASLLAAVAAGARAGHPGPEPARAEAPGVARWALVIDRARCASRAGCQACIEACHRAHRVPKAQQIDHEIKWIWKVPARDAFPAPGQPIFADKRGRTPVPVLCNHCSFPPCVRVCPTRATWQRADGVVAMDPHRCIGCRYCMAACPYGARSFGWENPRPSEHTAGATDYPRRASGVVEKCTFCVERLDRGRAPRCVEACEASGGGALTFGDLADPTSSVRHLLATRRAVQRRPELGTGPNVFYLL